MSLHAIDDAVAVVLAGGRGSRLAPLTDHCAKPALPFAGSFRTMDFVLSNCLNSGLNRIGVLTQYHSSSLIRYLSRSWQPLYTGPYRSLDIWPAEQRPDPHWFEGTADAVYRNLDQIQRYRPRHVLVLAADHVYRMDYRAMLDEHERRGASVSIGCIEVAASQCRHFGVMRVHDDGYIRRFVEKPASPMDLMTTQGGVIASMGIYVFETSTLVDLLSEDAGQPGSHHDFGRDIIPRLVRSGSTAVRAHRFHDPAADGPAYWRDVGTLDAYWHAHLEMAQPCPPIDLADPAWPVRGETTASAPPRLMCDPVSGQPSVSFNSLIAPGCEIQGALVRESVLYPHVHVGGRSVIERSVVLPGARIGADCRISNAIVCAGHHVPAGTVVGEERQADAVTCLRSEGGIAVVTPGGTYAAEDGRSEAYLPVHWH